jgi:hypothetical protein
LHPGLRCPQDCCISQPQFDAQCVILSILQPRRPSLKGLHLCTAVLPKTMCCEGCESKIPRGRPALSDAVQQQWRNKLGAHHVKQPALAHHACSLNEAPTTLQTS